MPTVKDHRVFLVFAELAFVVAFPLLSEVGLLSVQVLQSGLKHFIEVVFCQLIRASCYDNLLNEHLEIFLKRFKIVVVPHIVSVVQTVNRVNRSPILKHEGLVGLFVSF